MLFTLDNIPIRQSSPAPSPIHTYIVSRRLSRRLVVPSSFRQTGDDYDVSVYCVWYIKVVRQLEVGEDRRLKRTTTTTRSYFYPQTSITYSSERNYQEIIHLSLFIYPTWQTCSLNAWCRQLSRHQQSMLHPKCKHLKSWSMVNLTCFSCDIYGFVVVLIQLLTFLLILTKTLHAFHICYVYASLLDSDQQVSLQRCFWMTLKVRGRCLLSVVLWTCILADFWRSDNWSQSLPCAYVVLLLSAFFVVSDF